MNHPNDHIGLAEYAETTVPKTRTARPRRGQRITLRGHYVEGLWIVAEDSIDFGDAWFVRLRRGAP